jgi:GT2 family glycosyltransferase
MLPYRKDRMTRLVDRSNITLLDHSAVSEPIISNIRPCVGGKFIYVGGEKLYVRGVTYGTFRPQEDGNEYPDPDVVERDFAQMAENGINAVRTYTVPPRWLLDAAQRHGLRLMVGLAAERYIGFLNEPKGAPDVEELVRAGVRACAGHPAVLCYTLGNEIPSPTVRWLGRRRVEQYIKRLYRAAKAEDPEGLVTYVNYPSTEYLQLPFLDLFCFNVYLESQERLESYLARLHNLAGDRPLIMAEIGLDSLRNGENTQASMLDWQVRTAFAAGCAGVFVYAWTDEWYRGGAEVHDWAFGLTDRQRHPKPALAAVADAFAQVPFPQNLRWPRISVAVCSFNGAGTLRDCLEAVQRLEYPNYEVIVVNDGSTDATADIAREYDVRLISTENRGLSSARNTAMEAATGEIIAYIDDDAYPDPHWLTYYASTFLRTRHAAVGGPNIAPPGDGPVADAVDNAPGNPIHVLLTDEEAEHVPGCNMAVRKSCLQAIGGFDPHFRVAGDDVDVCWRLQQRGWTLGFSPAAMVWHHRRGSLRTYWKQQKGYGRAEAMLERKWPEKYNSAGHVTWAGQLYGKGITRTLGWHRGRVYQGIWGSAPFQLLYQPTPSTIGALPLLPEWGLVVLGLAALAVLGTLWTPLLLVLPLLIVALGASLVQAGLAGARASFASATPSGRAPLKLRALTAFLHLLQPIARLYGRLSYGLTPWRRRGDEADLSLPQKRTFAVWTDQWQASDARLGAIERELRSTGAVVLHGGDYDRWDLEVRGGLLGAARLLMAVEEHGGGNQLVRIRVWPRYSVTGRVLVLLFVALALGAGLSQAWAASAILAVGAVLLAFWMLAEGATAVSTMIRALARDGLGG